MPKIKPELIDEVHVERAIQNAFLKVYQRFVVYGEPEPEKLNTVLRRAIKNELLDGVRNEDRNRLGPMQNEADT